ncbi:hypothetical protein K9L97_02685 [Candidatus Woesearchaeota archaeon]|nr:hypothetical protein [Candidatus Woesearchaeota archaeon]
MEIHIDTKKDSDAEIMKAIRMLQAYVGQSADYGVQSSEYSSQNSEISNPSPGAFNIFDDANSSSSNSQIEEEEKEDKKEIPRIQFIDF